MCAMLNQAFAQMTAGMPLHERGGEHTDTHPQLPVHEHEGVACQM